MLKRWPVLSLAVLVVLIGSTALSVQGVQTGVIAGVVNSADGMSLPGVTVTVTSTALLGELRVVSDVNGVYLIQGLPGGQFPPGKTGKRPPDCRWHRRSEYDDGAGGAD